MCEGRVGGCSDIRCCSDLEIYRVAGIHLKTVGTLETRPIQNYIVEIATDANNEIRNGWWCRMLRVGHVCEKTQERHDECCEFHGSTILLLQFHPIYEAVQSRSVHTIPIEIVSEADPRRQTFQTQQANLPLESAENSLVEGAATG